MSNSTSSSPSSKIGTLLQFAYKANKLYFGESVIIRMLSRKVHVVVLAQDIADAQKKKYCDKAKYYQVPAVFYLPKADLGSLFGKNEVACVGVSDPSMAREILRLAGE